MTVTRRAAPLLWTDAIVASVVNRRLVVRELGAFYTDALFQIGIVDANGLSLFSCRIFGSVDGVSFPGPGVTAEALVSSGTVLAPGTSILRQPVVLSSDAGAPAPPRIFPSFLVFEYTATVVGRLTLEVHAVLEAADRPAGVEQAGDTPSIT